MLRDVFSRISARAAAAARALPRLLGLPPSPCRASRTLQLSGCIALAALTHDAGCTSTARDRALRLWQQAGGTAPQFCELEAVGLGEVLHVCAATDGRLVRDPPDGTELATYQQALHASTSLTGAEAWADATATDAASLARYTAQTRVLTIYCMLCGRNKTAAMDAMIDSVGLMPSPSTGGSSSGSGVSKPSDDVEAERLVRSATKLYNFNFARELARVQPSSLILTRDQMKINKFVFHRLTSSHYAVAKGVESGEKWLTFDADHNRMKEHEDEVNLPRNGLVLSTLFRVLMTGELRWISTVPMHCSIRPGAHHDEPRHDHSQGTCACLQAW